VGNLSLPKRHFTKGVRKLVGFRLPDELKKKISVLAEELGWTVTDVAQTALDQYVHEELPKTKAVKPKLTD
jgi:predicted transcriptional regulator